MTLEQSKVSTSVSTSLAMSRPEDVASSQPAGSRRALLALRLLAAVALMVSALIHARLSLDVGMDGPMLTLGHLFAINAVLNALVAVALLLRSNRAWLMAVVLSVSGMVAIVASVYFPLPAVGPFPGVDEPAWLLSKALAAFVEMSVITLWLVRRIAPEEPQR